MKVAQTAALKSFSMGQLTLRPFAGDKLMVVRVEAPKGGIAPGHAHSHEQLTLILDGILINLVAPGYILTERIREWNESYAAQERTSPEEITRRTTQGIPLGRYGTPEEIAEVIAFLLTKNNYVSGQQLLVDGALVVAS